LKPLGYVLTSVLLASYLFFINPSVESNFSDANNIVRSAQSEHPGGIMVGLVDGSCRFLTQTIPMSIYDAIMTRYGDEPIAMP
jgi:hypothetical protein